MRRTVSRPQLTPSGEGSWWQRLGEHQQRRRYYVRERGAARQQCEGALWVFFQVTPERAGIAALANVLPQGRFVFERLGIPFIGNDRRIGRLVEKIEVDEKGRFLPGNLLALGHFVDFRARLLECLFDRLSRDADRPVQSNGVGAISVDTIVGDVARLG